MAFETEGKFRVDSHQPVRERLQALGAQFVACVLETNRIFDRPDGSLRRRGCGLRIRSAVSEEAATDWKVGPTAQVGPTMHPATLTFKGPVVAGTFKSREELEVQISDAETAAHMLGLLGFVPILSYQKRRESWRLDDCRIELDEPAQIGLFVEIEGPDESAIRRLQVDLGLKGAAHVRSSYVRMLAAYCDEHGITDRAVNLPDPAAPPL